MAAAGAGGVGGAAVPPNAVPHGEKLGGFDFANAGRNARLMAMFEAARGGAGGSAHAGGHDHNVAHVPLARKTGTTICGVVYRDGVVLGADTRATEGTIVCDKNCEKIHYIADNIYCCGAGTSADTENTTATVSSGLELHRLNTGRQPRVVTALTHLKQKLFRYQGHVSAALVLGGVDCDGPHLHTVYPHGSTDRLPYVTMGSGSLAAMAVFEAGWKEDLSRDEAVKLVHAAISAGIFNDLGSGGNVDVCVITKDKTEMLRGYDQPNDRKFRRGTPYEFKEKAQVLAETVHLFKNAVVVEEVGAGAGAAAAGSGGGDTEMEG